MSHAWRRLYLTDARPLLFWVHPDFPREIPLSGEEDVTSTTVPTAFDASAGPRVHAC